MQHSTDGDSDGHFLVWLSTDGDDDESFETMSFMRHSADGVSDGHIDSSSTISLTANVAGRSRPYFFGFARCRRGDMTYKSSA